MLLEILFPSAFFLHALQLVSVYLYNIKLLYNFHLVGVGLLPHSLNCSQVLLRSCGREINKIMSENMCQQVMIKPYGTGGVGGVKSR